MLKSVPNSQLFPWPSALSLLWPQAQSLSFGFLYRLYPTVTPAHKIPSYHLKPQLVYWNNRKRDWLCLKDQWVQLFLNYVQRALTFLGGKQQELLCMWICVNEWVLTAASIWKNRGSKSPLYTQIHFSTRTRDCYLFYVLSYSLFDKKRMLLFKRNNLKKKWSHSTLSPQDSWVCPGGIPCLHPSTQRRSLLVPAPNNEDRASWLHLGQGGLLPRITWHQGIQTLSFELWHSSESWVGAVTGKLSRLGTVNAV